MTQNWLKEALGHCEGLLGILDRLQQERRQLQDTDYYVLHAVT